MVVYLPGERSMQKKQPFIFNAVSLPSSNILSSTTLSLKICESSNFEQGGIPFRERRRLILMSGSVLRSRSIFSRSEPKVGRPSDPEILLQTNSSKLRAHFWSTIFSHMEIYMYVTMLCKLFSSFWILRVTFSFICKFGIDSRWVRRTRLIN